MGSTLFGDRYRVDPTRLKQGSGTANFLREDGTFSAPTASAGDLVPQNRVPTSSQTLSADRYLHIGGYLTGAAGLAMTGAATARIDGSV